MAEERVREVIVQQEDLLKAERQANCMLRESVWERYLCGKC